MKPIKLTPDQIDATRRVSHVRQDGEGRWRRTLNRWLPATRRSDHAAQLLLLHVVRARARAGRIDDGPRPPPALV